MENKELKERFIDERTGIEYTLQGDYYIPNIAMPKANNQMLWIQSMNNIKNRVEEIIINEVIYQ